ncbi:pre-mRNA-processing factor 40 homolog B-like isoform X2 [Varroa destructor]|uniref:Uncharacterized protein n=1 Tax=Varroa destructor TaxID=109461 RepID=A0A7M7JTH8_VARDE|nr:pre-mRNA-processing factor 40 homolog B-like isoform X2 [Varroa destructor]
MDPHLLAAGIMPTFPAGVPAFVGFNPAAAPAYPQVPSAPVQIPLPGDAPTNVVAAPTSVAAAVAAGSPANPTEAPLPPATPSVGASDTTQTGNTAQCDWTEHTSPDGRIYYYNSVTRKSSWDKPDELKSSTELLLSRCPWKEYKSESGRLYYYNAETKESKWSIPKELEDIRRLLEMEGKVKTAVRLELPNSASGTPTINSPVASVEQPPIDEASRTSFAPDDDSQSNQDGAVVKLEYKDKREMADAFRVLLRERNVASNASWENAVKAISQDPRYAALKKLPDRKQIFNLYKTQRAKEEKEEQRMKIRKAKEDLEQFLLNSPQLNMNVRYKKAYELFGHLPVWTAVGDRERKELYDDIMTIVTKRDKEAQRALRKKNMATLADILDAMAEVTHRTTWQEAQQLLLDNPTFAEDAELLGMDKEDALTIFEDHIRELEKEHEAEREREKKVLKRSQRKAREGFQALLADLHDKGKLTSMSLWSELYPVIRSDPRFNNMLGQPGSTPLDLFKFFVAELKDRLIDEKKIIKEILREKNFTVEVDTQFEQFVTVISEDKRSATLDAGNVKLTYTALMEKAAAREKERLREEQRKVKRAEAAFRSILRNLSPPVEYDSSYDKIRPLIESHPDFNGLLLESERVRVFKEYTTALEEACSHHHGRSKKSKKNTKHKRNRSSSRSSVTSISSSSGGSSRKKKKKKKSRYQSRSPSPSLKKSRYLEASPSPSKRFSPVEDESESGYKASEKYRHYREATPEEGEVTHSRRGHAVRARIGRPT